MVENNDEDIEQLKDGIASALRELREQVGLSQADLAKIIGVHQSCVSRLETTKNDSIDLILLYRLFDAMNVDIEINFLEREETPEVGEGETESPPAILDA